MFTKDALVFTVTLFLTAKKPRKLLRCQPIAEQIKAWLIHTMEFYTDIEL